MRRNKHGTKRAEKLARIFRAKWYDPNHTIDWEKWIAHARKTRVPCSCSMCGNPRKHHNELTPQEKRANESMEQQLKELEL